jgi:hypothetical protein
MSAIILALACGFCLEDKLAATYDHALVQRAMQQRRVVVFAEPHAQVDDARLSKSLVAAAGRVRGVDAKSVRTSASPPTLSFVLDPAASNPRSALDAIGKAAALKGLRIELLRVIEPPQRP